MSDETNLWQLAAQLKNDLEKSGVDLAKYMFYPCVKDRGRFRILNRPFNEFSEIRNVAGSHSKEPVYVLEPKSPNNPIKIVNPSELL